MSFSQRISALVSQQTSDAERPLLELDVISRAPVQTATEGQNETYVVLLEGGRRAYHKPFEGVSVPLALWFGHHPDELPVNECAAWRLACALGPPYDELVGPCVLRECDGSPGSLSAHRDGLPHAIQSQLARPDLWTCAAFFDCLVGQQDRHTGNFRWESRRGELGLIDHGAAFAQPGFPCNASTFLDWRWRQAQGHLRHSETAALGRLLASKLSGLGDVLIKDAKRALRSRVERMLESGMVLRPGDF